MLKIRCSFQLLAVVLVLTFVAVLILQHVLSTWHIHLARRSIDKLVVSKKNDRTLKLIFEKFVRTAESENVTYFMFYGTLLGAFRYRGRIPWDDDIDVLVPSRLQDKILTRFNERLQPEFVIIETGDETRSLKMFSPSHSVAMWDKTWRWPFLDIAFYEENETHIWDTFRADSHRKYSKSDVFPLSRLVFEGTVAYAPHNVPDILKILYGDYHKCVVPIVSHRSENSWQKNSLVVSCDDL